ncbi:hypothetical protein L208DRAFT_434617 [Tricholoma matsutake]|nr:hypothetical protein L208DRAFT_434617 [Tricholoma matsutake 945]
MVHIITPIVIAAMTLNITSTMAAAIPGHETREIDGLQVRGPLDAITKVAAPAVAAKVVNSGLNMMGKPQQNAPPSPLQKGLAEAGRKSTGGFNPELVK